MNCNIKDCFWNTSSDFRRQMLNNTWEFQCVSKDLPAHYDKNDGFKLNPNNIHCPGYRKSN